MQDQPDMASLMLLQFSKILKSTLSVPAIDIVDRKVLAIGCGCAMDDDAFDLSCHAAQYRAICMAGKLKMFKLCGAGSCSF
jgi:hypothetical protein